MVKRIALLVLLAMGASAWSHAETDLTCVNKEVQEDEKTYKITIQMNYDILLMKMYQNGKLIKKTGVEKSRHGSSGFHCYETKSTGACIHGVRKDGWFQTSIGKTDYGFGVKCEGTL